VEGTKHKTGNDGEANLERSDTLSVIFSSHQTPKTALGKVFDQFSLYLRNAIIDGRMTLLQRGGPVPEKLSDINLPQDLRHFSEEGYYLSSFELKRVLNEYHIEFVSKNEDRQLGYEQFSTVLDTILAECTDYSATELTPVNRPAPQDKLQNTPVQRHRGDTLSKRLKGGGMRECI